MGRKTRKARYRDSHFIPMHESIEPNGTRLEKLRRLLCFLNGTINDVRVLEADELDSLLTFVDAAYAVHPNMRGHTGGVMSMGTGVVHAKSSKQKNQHEKFHRVGGSRYK